MGAGMKAVAELKRAAAALGAFVRRGLLTAVALALLGASVTSGETRFFPVEVRVAAGARPLAAYQIEVRYDGAALRIVGLEGGDELFRNAPYFDPRGMEAGRIVIASFTLDRNPPTGTRRVARIHFQAVGAPDFPTEARLVLAADPEGETFSADVTIQSEGGNRK